MSEDASAPGRQGVPAPAPGTGEVSLRPVPERAGRCPRCERPLRVRRLRLPGWRALVDGDCDGCGHRYLQDLPSGHGLVYPAALDLDTGETFDPVGAPWFANALRETWERPDGDPVRLELPARRGDAPALLLDCLDPVYGHALLKLLNASGEAVRRDRRLVALVPGALEALVPAGAEAWVVREPVGRLRGWLVELEAALDSEFDRLGDCLLARALPHPHPSTYRLGDHLAGIEAERAGEPSLLLALRDDRTWGTGRDDQAARAARLAELLRERWPALGVAVAGVGAPGGLPGWVLDLRAPAPSLADERRWLALMRGADLALGVHGSHLLLPSGLAAATIELLPEPRYANALQATLVSERDPVLALARHRTLHGDADLADVTPERVAALAEPLVRDAERLRLLLAGPAAGLGAGETVLPPLPAEAPPAPPPEPTLVERVRMASPRRFARERVAERRRSEAQRALDERVATTPLPAVLAGAGGLRFEVESPEELRSLLAHGGLGPRAELEACARIAEPGAVVVDAGAGAHAGAFAAVLARAVGHDGRVHAFEPLPEARRRLERTLALNSLENVVVRAEALGDTGARALDAYAAAAGIERVGLLRVAAGAGAPRVLAGASALLASGAIGAALLELPADPPAAADERAAALLELLDAAGLHSHVVEDGRLRPFRVAGRADRLLDVVALSEGARARARDLLG